MTNHSQAPLKLTWDYPKSKSGQSEPREDLSSPPSKPVAWEVYQRKTTSTGFQLWTFLGNLTGFYQTWFSAREQAALQFLTPIEELKIVQSEVVTVTTPKKPLIVPKKTINLTVTVTKKAKAKTNGKRKR